MHLKHAFVDIFETRDSSRHFRRDCFRHLFFPRVLLVLLELQLQPLFVLLALQLLPFFVLRELQLLPLFVLLALQLLPLFVLLALLLLELQLQPLTLLTHGG